MPWPVIEALFDGVKLAGCVLCAGAVLWAGRACAVLWSYWRERRTR